MSFKRRSSSSSEYTCLFEILELFRYENCKDDEKINHILDEVLQCIIY